MVMMAVMIMMENLFKQSLCLYFTGADGDVVIQNVCVRVNVFFIITQKFANLQQ